MDTDEKKDTDVYHSVGLQNSIIDYSIFNFRKRRCKRKFPWGDRAICASQEDAENTKLRHPLNLRSVVAIGTVTGTLIVTGFSIRLPWMTWLSICIWGLYGAMLGLIAGISCYSIVRRL